MRIKKAESASSKSKQNPKRKRIRRSVLGILFLAWVLHFYHVLPDPLFDVSYCKLLLDEEGDILSVRIAEDEQWRFPIADSVPGKYATAACYFEDEYFEYHPGVNPVSMARALWQNLRSDEVVSGGSTLTMQVIRLSRKDQPRTVSEKVVEMYLALRLEFRHSKETILGLYAGHAPFGGNVVGLHAACRKYFGRSPEELSWAEAATLAVLPNSPALIFPGKNTRLLRNKRDRLLVKLFQNNVLDSTDYQLALQEAIPTEFLSYPALAPHALDFCISKHPNRQTFHATLDQHLQKRTTDIVQHYVSRYAGNNIHNAAALILDLKKNEVVSYLGNTKPIKGTWYQNYVDIIQAPRSTGSILKPFLYGKMLDEGLILPQTIIPDIPTVIQGFAPQNYSKRFEGAVKADQALARSLNIPAVRMLRQYGYPKFHAALREIGLTTINRSADTYGLALILGGAEATLWDLSMAYGGMARALQNFEDYPLNKSYRNSDYQFPKLSQYDTLKESAFVPHGHFTASALWHTVEALTEVKRPDEEGNWRLFENSKTIAWKTGTSFGLRDAWAVGVTPDYLVAVWVGNATGEGRPGLVGVKKAAPIMFSLFNLLPKKGWFEEPGRALEELVVCAQSGHIASENCAAIDTISAPLPGKKTDACPYCQTVFLNDAGQAVNSSCSAVSAMHSQKRFVLPPVQEWYFKQKSASYIGLPRPAPGCGPLRALPFDLIYPKEGAKVFLPRTHNHKGSLVCDATHIHKTATLFWHLDAEYLGKTTRTHQMELSPTKGKHQLFLVDENGNEMSIGFEVL